jgi:oxidase EvaA
VTLSAATSAGAWAPAGDRDAVLRERFLASAATEANPFLSTAEIPGWLAERTVATGLEVERIKFSAMDRWRFASGTGDLVHDSGRFFSIQGLQVQTDFGPVRQWSQPIIAQPEVGILGILVKEFGGTLYCLLQAKAEPGNINSLQLSPTVQATRSNYTRVHNGGQTRYLEYFTGHPGARVLLDSLQPEQGARFLRKRNRNMVVEITGDIEPAPDFCWLTVGQLHHLLRRDHVVNMDSRTVISCMPLAWPAEDSLESLREIINWLTEMTVRFEMTAGRVPLAALPGWRQADDEIFHEPRQSFNVIGVSILAPRREVQSWAQPMLRPEGDGLVAFLLRNVDGVPHVLVQAKLEPGNVSGPELAPTVQCVPGSYPDPAARPRFLDLVLGAGQEQVRYDVRHSEEGGRFFRQQTRHMIIEVTDEAAGEVAARGDGAFRWVSVRQLEDLVGLRHQVNIESRGLLACLRTLR